MSRISKLERSEVTPEMSALYDKIFAQRGNVPNMFRTWRTGRRFSRP